MKSMKFRFFGIAIIAIAVLAMTGCATAGGGEPAGRGGQGPSITIVN